MNGAPAHDCIEVERQLFTESLLCAEVLLLGWIGGFRFELAELGCQSFDGLFRLLQFYGRDFFVGMELLVCFASEAFGLWKFAGMAGDADCQNGADGQHEGRCGHTQP